MVKFDLSQAAEVLTSINHYMELANHLHQIDPKQRETLTTLYDRAKAHSKDKIYMDHVAYQYWQDINIHTVGQHWGSTSCGWGGMGGAAMTDSYTTIIENLWIGGAFVYYNGKLAYIVDMDDKYSDFLDKSKRRYAGFPGLSEVSSVFTVFYRAR